MSQENVEMIRSLVPGDDVDLVQIYREDPDRGAATRAAVESHFHPDFEGVRRDIPGGEP
jgi:hypothetical protein